MVNSRKDKLEVIFIYNISHGTPEGPYDNFFSYDGEVMSRPYSASLPLIGLTLIFLP